MRFAIPVVAVGLLSAAIAGGQGQAPVFRTKVEVVQLDVSVLDKHRQPVRGLTGKDFTILEDGKPQPIVGFAIFDFDAAPAPATGWMRDVAPDVATNQHKETRLFVIVMDDGLIPQDPFAIQSSKKIATSIIDKLGDDDLTAIVFTGDNRKTQDFTSDKAKLRAALDKFNPGLAGYRFGLDLGTNEDIAFYQATIRTLDGIADHLASVPGQRKMVFWISPGVPMDLAGAVPQDKDGCPVPERWDPKTGLCTILGGSALSNSGKLICLTGPGTCGPAWPTGVWGRSLPPFEMSDLAKRTDDVFRRAQRANVTIYPIDPNGLDGSRAYLTSRLGSQNQGFAGQKATTQLDFLTMTAENTGGHAIINTNDFEPGIARAFEENESYYLIAFEPTNTASDGKLRRLEVKVNRPDVEVRSRSSYYAPEPEKSNKKLDAMTPEAAALAKAMSGILPMAGMPMRVAVAPFAVPGQRLATVAIVLGIRQPIPPAAAKDRITETTELLTSAFTPEGDARGAQRHTAKVVLRAGADGEAAYEVLARIDLPAGRYQLRLAAHNTTSSRDGSVFADVIVPDYSNIPFSASPVVLSATPGRVSAPKDLLSPLLPLVPTAEREFTADDKVTAFLRLYQNGQKPVERVQLAISIRDAQDRMEASETRTLGADQFPAAGQQVIPAATPVAPRPPGMAAGLTQSTAAGDQFANLSLRTADVKYQIPLSKLAPGPHLLTFEATLGSTTIRRDVRFVVK